MSSRTLGARRVVLRNVSFAFPAAPPLLEGVDLSLGPGFTAIVGPNGAGKTTLLRLLSGEFVPDRGSLELPPRAHVVLCAQACDARIDMAFAERTDGAAQRLRQQLGLRPHALARGALSPGERRRWQIGAALGAEPDVLLLDEPTNHLDVEGRERLITAMRAFRGVGVLVSHDRVLLDAVTHTTVRVESGAATAWAGAYSEAHAAWSAHEAARLDERTQLQGTLRRAQQELERARRHQGATERGRSTASRMRSVHDSDARTLAASTRAMWADAGAGRAVARRHVELERAASALAESGPVTKARGRSLFVDFEPATRRAVLSLDAPTLERGGHVLMRDVRVSLGRSDRVRLAGPNGAGKTTLLTALLAGVSDPRVLVVPQVIDAEAGRRAIEALRGLGPEARGRAMSVVAALGADAAGIVGRGTASPGEARQLSLALGLAARAHTVVLDEPTNDLDLPAIERLEQALVDFPGALLVVTHDDALAARLGLETWRIEADRAPGLPSRIVFEGAPI